MRRTSRRRARTTLVALASVLIAIPFVATIGVGIAAASSTSSTTVIQIAGLTADSSGAYSTSVTNPTPFSTPAVSDAAGDSFLYAITGSNTAECTVGSNGQGFNYEHPGTCVVLITAAVNDNDGDNDAVGKTNPSTCNENESGNVRAHLRRAHLTHLAHLATVRTDTTLTCSTSTSTTLTLTVLDQTRSVVVDKPATGSNGVYTLSVTAPTSVTIPPVSDGVSSDTFTFALSGTNSAGCAVGADGSSFSYQSVGTCTVLIDAVPVNSDTDGDPSDTGTTSAAATLTINVLAHPQSISLGSTTANYQTSVLLAATGYSGTGTLTYALVGGTASGCAITSAHELSATTAGTCLVQAHISADATYAAATSPTATITFRSAPVVTRPPAPVVTTTTSTTTTTTTVPAPPVTTTTAPAPVITSQSLSLSSGHLTIGGSWRLAATGYSGTGTLTYALVGGTASGCAVTSTHLLRATEIGTCRVQAHIAASGTYAAATSNIATIDFLAQTQSITLSSGHVKFGGSWPLKAQGYSGDGTVSYRLVAGTARGCAISARDVLTATSAGTCVVRAFIAAAGNYDAATSDAATITFDPAPVLPTLVVKNSAAAAPPKPPTAPTIAMSVASFSEGSYLLSPSLDAQINAIAAKVKAKRYHVVDLTAYTDNVFTPAFNLALNAQRAAAVTTRLLADLAARHVRGVRVVVVTSPRRYVFLTRSNVTPTGRAYNRRVVATLFAH